MRHAAHHRYDLGTGVKSFRLNSLPSAWHAAWRFLTPGPRTIAAAIIITALGLGVWGFAKAHARIEWDAERRALCARQLADLRARNPFVERYVTPVDPCMALELVAR